MRQTQVENMLKDFEDRIKKLESNYFIGVDIAKEDNIQEKQRKGEAGKESGVTVEKPIPDTPQENYKESVDETERIAKNKRPIPLKKGVSTTESGVGKSPVGA